MNSPSWLHLASEKNTARQLFRDVWFGAMGAGAKIVCAAFFLRGTITLVQYAAYFLALLSSCLARGGGGSFAGGYHSILITLVRVTLHFYSFSRYVGAIFCCWSSRILLMNLLSFACAMQGAGVDTFLGDLFERYTTHSAAHCLSTSTALLAYCTLPIV